VFFSTNRINTYMKNIKTFESYNVIDMERNEPIKKYGETFPLTNLKIGDKVTYLGGPFIVDKVDEYSLLLRSVEDGSTIRVNQNMFNQRGYIGSI
jgi:hypothetical protein